MLVPRSVASPKTALAHLSPARLPSLAEADRLLAKQQEDAKARATQEHTAVLDDKNNCNDTKQQQHHGRAQSIAVMEPTPLDHKDEGEPVDALQHGPLLPYASSQRMPVGGEPACAVCSHSGEYVLDQAVHAVCSLECKGLEGASKQITAVLGPIHGPVYIPSTSNTHATVQEPSGPLVSAPPRPAPFYSSTRMVANITGYRDSPRTVALSSQDSKALRELHKIHVEGKHIPKPIQSFEDCNLPERMLTNLIEAGYMKPTGVQMQVIPAGLYGRDMVISAETGAGKTAAFLIPILLHAYGLAQLPGDGMQGPFALILTPTRELAIQIEEVAKTMVKGMLNMRTALLIAGPALSNQVHRLKTNIQIAIATPGRMVDILAKHGEIGFSNIHCLILDEVDVILSMGFIKQVKRILDVLPEPPNGRQSILCSATIPRQIEQLIGRLMQNNLRIRVGDIETPPEKQQQNQQQQSNTRVSDVFSPASKIKQTVMWVENDSKKKQLFSLLKDPAYFRPPVLVFVESRIGADLLAQVIQVKCPGIIAVSMHGEKPQEERTAIMKSITEGTVPVVVATGLLARGLDLKVATVINFDMAPSIQEYVHRVGRANPEAATKAAEGLRKGPKLGGMAWAITFINNDHRPILNEFANMLHGLDIERVTPLPPQLKQLVATSSSTQGYTMAAVQAPRRQQKEQQTGIPENRKKSGRSDKKTGAAPAKVSGAAKSSDPPMVFGATEGSGEAKLTGSVKLIGPVMPPGVQASKRKAHGSPRQPQQQSQGPQGASGHRGKKRKPTR